MEIRDGISSEVLQAVTGLLEPYVEDISATGLVDALKSYQEQDPPQTIKPKCYTVKETATMLSCSVCTVYRMVQAGKLQTINLAGKSVRIPAREIAKFLSPQ